MVNVLVTGGAGFIGSHIVSELIKDGHNVRILDNFSTGKKENVNYKAELINGDITDLKVCEKAVKNIDWVCHHAAMISVPLSMKNPLTCDKINIIGTLNLLEASRKNRVKKFVMASSCAIYGNTIKMPINEETILSPLSPYAISKTAGEYYCKIYNDEFNLPTISLRYFNVYGPRQNFDSTYGAVIPKFIHAIKANSSPTIFGDGKQTRDFIFVKDIVNANMLALKNKESGFSLNIGSGMQTNLLELIDEINKIYKRNVNPTFEEGRKGEIKYIYANVSKAREILNFTPKYSLSEGLKETSEWINTLNWKTAKNTFL